MSISHEAVRRFAIETDRWVDEVYERSESRGNNMAGFWDVIPTAVVLRFDRWWRDQGGEIDDAEYDAAKEIFDAMLVSGEAAAANAAADAPDAAETLADESMFFWWRRAIQLGTSWLEPAEMVRRLAPCSDGFKLWFRENFDKLPSHLVRGPNWEDRHRRIEPEDTDAGGPAR
jgi:hypothetical protein